MTRIGWHTDGARIGTWKAPDGWLIRTAHWVSSGTCGTIFFLNGKGDFIEKYAEVCRDWVTAGYHVVTWDWRGQGLSGRMFGDSTRAHLESLDVLLDDALGLLRAQAGQSLPKPWYLCAHSLGGHLALRILHDAPDLFAKAALCAPMLGLNTGPFPARLARRIVRLMLLAGQGKRFAFGQTPFGATTRSEFRQQRLTSDISRFREEAEAIDANPELASGGVTFGWVDAAFKSIDVISAAGYLEAIQTPVLVLLAGRELIVDSFAAETLASRLPKGNIVWIEGAAHELLREKDEIRSKALALIDHFLTGKRA
jgi:lysophospholipase